MILMIKNNSFFFILYKNYVVPIGVLNYEQMKKYPICLCEKLKIRSASFHSLKNYVLI